MAKKRVGRKTAAKQPVPADIDDPKLGLIQFRCHLNPEMDEYGMTAELNDENVEITLYSDESLDMTPTIKRCRELLRRHNAIMKRANSYLGKHQLKEYNEIWREPDEHKLSKPELLQRVELTLITIHADGTGAYWFDDGGLFSGHCIVLEMDSKTNFVGSDTSG